MGGEGHWQGCVVSWEAKIHFLSLFLAVLSSSLETIVPFCTTSQGPGDHITSEGDEAVVWSVVVYKQCDSAALLNDGLISLFYCYSSCSLSRSIHCTERWLSWFVGHPFKFILHSKSFWRARQSLTLVLYVDQPGPDLVVIVLPLSPRCWD